MSTRTALGAVLLVSLGVSTLYAQSSADISRIARPGYAARDPADELLDLRSATAKHFLNADGTITAYILPVPLHYQDRSGGWREIDTAFRRYPDPDAPYPFSVTAHPFQIYLGATSKDGYLVELGDVLLHARGDSDIRIESSDGRLLARYERAASTAQVSGNRLVYPRAYDVIPVDEVLTVTRRGLKHEWILASPPLAEDHGPGAVLIAREHVVLPVGSVIEPAPADSTAAYVIRNASRHVVGVIPRAVACELAAPDSNSAAASSVTCGIRTVSAERSITLETHVPLDWLLAPDRRYPVSIDPTIELEPTQWGWSTPTGGDCTKQSEYVKIQGGSGCGTRVGWLFFDISNLPQYITVSAMELSVYPWNGSSNWDIQLRGMGSAVPSQSCSQLASQVCSGNNYGSGSGTYSLACRITFTCWRTWPLLSSAYNDLKTAREQLRPWFSIGIRSASTSTTNYVDIVATSTIELEPELQITYCQLPGPPSGVSATDGLYCDKVRITWNPVSGATGYKVYRNGALIGQTAGTSFDDTSAVPGTIYNIPTWSGPRTPAGTDHPAPLTTAIAPASLALRRASAPRTDSIATKCALRGTPFRAPRATRSIAMERSSARPQAPPSTTPPPCRERFIPTRSGPQTSAGTGHPAPGTTAIAPASLALRPASAPRMGKIATRCALHGTPFRAPRATKSIAMERSSARPQAPPSATPPPRRGRFLLGPGHELLRGRTTQRRG